jgi:ERCC4-related helicase
MYFVSRSILYEYNYNSFGQSYIIIRLLALNQVNLLIFDECHHASGNNNYAALMNKHYDACPDNDRPRILGLTASISAKKIKAKDLMNCMQELQRTFR